MSQQCWDQEGAPLICKGFGSHVQHHLNIILAKVPLPCIIGFPNSFNRLGLADCHNPWLRKFQKLMLKKKVWTQVGMSDPDSIDTTRHAPSIIDNTMPWWRPTHGICCHHVIANHINAHLHAFSRALCCSRCLLQHTLHCSCDLACVSRHLRKPANKYRSPEHVRAIGSG